MARTYISKKPRPRPEPSDDGIPNSVRDYLDSGAPEGERNRTLFAAACQLRDVGGSVDQAETILLPRAAADGLSEAEAGRTIGSAFAGTPREAPRGAGIQPLRVGGNGRAQTSQKKDKPRAKLEGSQPVPLPEPDDEGFVKLLQTAFKKGERICIAATKENDEGERKPEGGVTLTRETWLKKVREKGGIDKVFTTKHGLFIRVNPMDGKDVGNANVTAFRHVLVEFDQDLEGNHIPKEEQFGMILKSGLPVTAVLDSGNKSVHAWVRVDAPDSEAYEERVDEVYHLFADHHLDKANRNPSRLSRTPDAPRIVGVKEHRQSLLMLNAGAESWDEWESHEETRLLGSPVTVADLLDFDTENDPTSLLGKRWLCRGGSLTVVGQSGVGKSSMNTQLAMAWALGRGDMAFGINPVRPLKSLVLQAENDKGDLAEMLQGVTAGFSLKNDDMKRVSENLLFHRITDKVGDDFLRVAEQLVNLHRPDLLWIDPLLNFLGDDISDQRVIAHFCQEGLNAIAARTGVVNVVIHHMGKPPKEGRGGMTGSDMAYAGLGSSALTNWSREVLVFHRVEAPEGDPPTFHLMATKRRTRAGMIDPTTEDVTESIYVRHSGVGITWEQCEKPEEPEKEDKPKRGGRKKSSGNTYRRGSKGKSEETGGGRPSNLDPRVENRLRALYRKSGGKIKPEHRREFARIVDVHPSTVARWEEQLGLKPKPITKE